MLFRSFPIQSGHGCIGCSENDFWDQGGFYDRLTRIPVGSTSLTAADVGIPATVIVSTAVAVHAGISAVTRARAKLEK